MINQKTYRVIPDPSDGVYDVPGSWTVLEPLKTIRTNLARNPSAELSAEDEWFDGGSFPASCDYPIRSTAQHWIGVASFSMVSNNTDSEEQSGFYFTPERLGTHYASVYVRKTGKLDTFEINVDGIINPRYVLYKSYDHNSSATDDWFRWVYAFDVVDLTPKLCRFRSRQYTSGENYTVYMDGVMIERAQAVLPYFDGTYAGASWAGLPHRSESILNYEAHPLSEYGFQATAVIGGNAPIWNTISTPFAFGGGYYQKSTPGMSEISIVGTIEAMGRIELETKRRLLAKALSPRAGVPAILLYQPAACNVEDYSKAVRIEAVYMSGLEGNLTNEYQETVSLNLRIHTPYICTDRLLETFSCTTQTVLNAKMGILKRNSEGVWSNMPVVSPYSGYVLATYAFSPDGVLFATYANGTNDLRLVFFDEDNQTVVQLGAFTTTRTTEPCQINRIRFDNGGALWVCGNFTSIDGAPNDTWAQYSSIGWSSPVSTITEGYVAGIPRIQDFWFSDDGHVYVVGNFNNINGTPVKNLALYTGSGFINVGAGINGSFGDTAPPTLKFERGGADLVYIYGRFGGIGLDTSRNLWLMDTITGATYPTGDVAAINTNEVTQALLLQSGMLMIIGTFTKIDGAEVISYANYNGASFEPIPQLGSYIPPTFISQGNDGLIHSGRPMTNVLNGGWLQFNGTWLVRPEYRPGLDAYDPGSGGALVVAESRGDEVWLMGVPKTGTPVPANVPYTNVINNEGDANAWPEVYFVGPMNLFSLTNYTTGKRITFVLTLADGETATLKFYPQLEFKSNTGRDLRVNIQMGSAVREFYLVPGENNINVGCDVASGGDDIAVFTWANTYDSIGAAFLR